MREMDKNIFVSKDPNVSEETFRWVGRLMSHPVFKETSTSILFSDFYEEIIKTKPKEISHSRKKFRYKYVLLRRVLMFMLGLLSIGYSIIPDIFVDLSYFNII